MSNLVKGLWNLSFCHRELSFHNRYLIPDISDYWPVSNNKIIYAMPESKFILAANDKWLLKSREIELFKIFFAVGRVIKVMNIIGIKE